MTAEGAAFVDRTGRVLAANETFRSQLHLPDGDPSDGLRRRAEGEPALRALLAGEGPDEVSLEAEDGAPVDLLRTFAESGMLLVARGAVPSPALVEHAMRSEAMSRIAAGVAHDIKNPLNAMALQIAILADKLSSAEHETAAELASGHLAALRDQIGRVNDVLRRFLDVVDPAAPLGYTDLGGWVADLASLHAHDARRHRVDLAVDATAGSVRCHCDPARVGRLLLVLFSRALSETPAGGRLAVRATMVGDEAIIELWHRAGAGAASLAWMDEPATATARALGGSLSRARQGDEQRVTLRLPRGHPA